MSNLFSLSFSFFLRSVAVLADVLMTLPTAARRGPQNLQGRARKRSPRRGTAGETNAQPENMKQIQKTFYKSESCSEPKNSEKRDDFKGSPG